MLYRIHSLYIWINVPSAIVRIYISDHCTFHTFPSNYRISVGTLALYVFVLARARLQRASDTRTAHSPQNVYKIISFTKFDVAHANKINLDIIDKSQGHNVYAAWDRG